MSVRHNLPLSNDQLYEAAPAIFAMQPSPKVSDRYMFLPTIDMIEAMRVEDWLPVAALQQRHRTVSREFGKHQVHFRHASMMDRSIGLQDTFLEIILRTAHNGSNAWNLQGGLFRLVCLNGMTISDGFFAGIHVRHVGPKEEVSNVIEGSFKVLNETDKVAGRIQHLSSVQLERPQQVEMAEKAIKLRWPKGDAPVDADKVLQARRWVDRGDSAWLVYNRLQENLIKGGIEGRNANGRRTTIRQITGIDANRRINDGLFDLAAEYAEAA
jgi:hypothetical protein